MLRDVVACCAVLWCHVCMCYRVTCDVCARAGIMKVNLSGPGLTETVKTLWRRQPAAGSA
jgi:hypothetical protein